MYVHIFICIEWEKKNISLLIASMSEEKYIFLISLIVQYSESKIKKKNNNRMWVVSAHFECETLIYLWFIKLDIERNVMFATSLKFLIMRFNL